MKLSLTSNNIMRCNRGRNRQRAVLVVDRGQAPRRSTSRSFAGGLEVWSDLALLFRAISDKNDEARLAKNYLDECAQG